jgi:hypothetical protein
MSQSCSYNTTLNFLKGQLSLLLMTIFSHFPIFTVAMGTAIAGGLLLAMIRKWVAVHLLTSHHEVAFPIFLQIGVIYAVMLAFIFSMVLNDINDAYTEVKIETTNILTLAQLAPGFPDEVRQMIDEGLLNYTKTVIEREWPKMAKHQEEHQVSVILDALQKIYLNFNPKTIREQVIYESSLEHLAKLHENRRLRIFTASQPRLENPIILLTMLGLIVISISYFFGMHRLWAQMILTGALIFTITSILMVIFTLSNPFAGKFGISTEVFENALVRLHEVIRE